MISAVKRSIGFTIGFHNHGDGPYYGLLLVESATFTFKKLDKSQKGRVGWLA